MPVLDSGQGRKSVNGRMNFETVQYQSSRARVKRYRVVISQEKPRCCRFAHCLLDGVSYIKRTWHSRRAIMYFTPLDDPHALHGQTRPHLRRSHSADANERQTTNEWWRASAW